MDRRKDAAVKVCVVIMALTLALAAGLALFQRWQESEREKAGAVARTESLQRVVAELIDFIESLRLKYGITEEIEPEIKHESLVQTTSSPTGIKPLGDPPAPATAALSTSIPGALDLAAVEARMYGGAWQFTDNPDEYIYYAMRESTANGDSSGQASHLWRTGEALYYGEPTYPMSAGYAEAAAQFYGGWKFDRCLELLRCTRSRYYGHGLDAVRYLRSRGREWETALAIMYHESTCATNPAARNDFGVCDATIDMSIDLQGYCDYLDKWLTITYHDSSINDPRLIMTVYNDHESYRANFYSLRNQLKGWRP